MLRRLGVMLVALMLTVMIATPAVQAQGGPFGMFGGSVRVMPMYDDQIDVHHLVFNFREARGNQSANSHFFAKSSDGAIFDYRVDRPRHWKGGMYWKK